MLGRVARENHRHSKISTWRCDLARIRLVVVVPLRELEQSDSIVAALDVANGACYLHAELLPFPFHREAAGGEGHIGEPQVRVRLHDQRKEEANASRSRTATHDNIQAIAIRPEIQLPPQQ